VASPALSCFYVPLIMCFCDCL